VVKVSNFPYKALYADIEAFVGALYINIEVGYNHKQQFNGNITYIFGQPETLHVISHSGQLFQGRKITVEVPEIAEVLGLHDEYHEDSNKGYQRGIANNQT
jgi:hypothetical protein